MNYYDLSGTKFGSLLVVCRAEDHIKPSGKKVVQYLCVCECGNTKVIQRQNLVDGHTKTCGCRGKSETIPTPKAEKAEVVKEKRLEYGYCIYNPKGLDCNSGFCSQCGWNPSNTELRNRRIANIKRKDGTDE
jgi:hypothetical protein